MCSEPQSLNQKESQMNTHRLYPATGKTASHATTRPRQRGRSLLLVPLAVALGTVQPAVAANIAPMGDGILGVKATVDSNPGQILYQAGTLVNINDNDLSTRVDNWSGGNDLGQGVSFVGVSWPTLRYESISILTLTLATFSDGGWFGPNGTGPGAGGTLTPAYLTAPTVQVSTNGGTNWSTVAFSSDYLTALNGASIGGGANPFANPLTTTFLLDPPVTNINALRIIGSNGGNAGPDANGFLGVFELEVEASFTDSDFDSMPDAWERANGLNDTINDADGDLDSDGLSNLAEYQANTDPKNPDTDGDGYSDGVETANGSNPRDSNSIPGNLARNGTGLLGTHNDVTGIDTLVYNAGTAAYINDGILGSHVDTWNGGGIDTKSFVGIAWSEAQANPVLRLELTLATFGDGGWFGPNNKSPVPGGALTPTYLTEPEVQVSVDGGATWSPAEHTSDYLTVMNGHHIGGGIYPNPNPVTATFILDPPAANISGVRIIGSEGGVASGGFLGVSELKVYAKTDVDGDGMDDDWERKHGLVVGVKDGDADLDGDGLKNLQEYLGATDPQNPDSDGDNLKDGDEVNIYHTNPASADTDADGLNDGAEVNTYKTNPLIADTDGDGFPDGLEVQLGSNPTNAASTPANFAFRPDASGILGTEDFPGGTDTLVFNAGAAMNINDGNLTTRVDSYSTSPDTSSFVGILWTNKVTAALSRLELSLATFFDGGWFGVNNNGPGAGGVLSSTYLLAPTVQVTTDGGTTWNDAAFTSDYLVALEGHALPAVAYGPPTLATAHFQLTPPQSNIDGIRIIGTEGGTASAGFLGVFELAVLTGVPQSVSLLNPAISSGQFQFEFDTLTGANYEVQYKSALADATWQILKPVTGDGTRKMVTDPLGAGPRFYRVESK
jgi:hypothetical protein